MLWLLSCLAIEVASVTLPATVYQIKVVRRLIKATFYRVGQAINPGGSAGVCQRLVLWVELVRTAATSIYRGKVLSHPSTHSSLLVCVGALGDWRYKSYISRP